MECSPGIVLGVDDLNSGHNVVLVSADDVIYWESAVRTMVSSRRAHRLSGTGWTDAIPPKPRRDWPALRVGDAGGHAPG
jgi:hypothetical protein